MSLLILLHEFDQLVVSPFRGVECKGTIFLIRKFYQNVSSSSSRTWMTQLRTGKVKTGAH